ncbi:MAG: short-subunit dehydrogenase [Paraglaciecola sp.]|jgi:short-subunit dehydrogenase
MNSLDRLNARFPDKIALITGAASGLGEAFACSLYHEGWTLHLCDKNEHLLAKSVGAYEHNDTQIFKYPLDVSNKVDFERVAQSVLSTSSRLDLLINSAGIGDGEFFENYDDELWRQMIEVNLMGTYQGVRLFSKQLISQKSGHIINIGSAAGFMNAPGMSAYNVSKAGVYSLSETLYHEYKRHGIGVSVATPTFFSTNIMSDAAGNPAMKQFAQYQMKNESETAATVATVILAEASKETFHILFPKQARSHWRLKKFFPGMVRKQFKKLIERMDRA